ncbi:hypothetical protein BgAZ_204970 [Babesia gibsoni]|uniref:Copper transport protein n=1 Tax=Babesia gibsoni TaxID=33632 RepID=A0AAD8LRF6_BABGI|nr:hypothetical protein BgAZ_204970 [Babesia gibsoni]
MRTLFVAFILADYYTCYVNGIGTSGEEGQSANTDSVSRIGLSSQLSKGSEEDVLSDFKEIADSTLESAGGNAVKSLIHDEGYLHGPSHGGERIPANGPEKSRPFSRDSISDVKGNDSEHGLNTSCNGLPSGEHCLPQKCSSHKGGAHKQQHQGSYTVPRTVIHTSGGCCSNSSEKADEEKECSEKPESCGMAAYFYNSYDSVILFSFWRTKSAGSYFPTLCIVFALSLFTVFMKLARNRMTEKYMSKSRQHQYTLEHLFLGVIAFIVSFLDFSIMLVVMTYNVGIVLTVCVAYAIGYVLSCYTIPLLEGGNRKNPHCECPADCC